MWFQVKEIDFILQNIAGFHLYEILIAFFAFTLTKQSKLEPKRIRTKANLYFANTFPFEANHWEAFVHLLLSLCLLVHEGEHVGPPTFQVLPSAASLSCPFRLSGGSQAVWTPAFALNLFQGSVSAG